MERRAPRCADKVVLIAAVLLGGCIWTNRSSPGKFVTSVTIVGRALQVDRCRVDYSVTHVALVVPVVGPGVAPQSAEGSRASVSTENCTRRLFALPVDRGHVVPANRSPGDEP